jgi:hypothetical protein
MKDTIFDLVEKTPVDGKQGFFDLAKEYGKTILKGSIEGISRLGTIMGPLPKEGKTSEQELEEQTETLNELLPTEEGFTQSALRRGLKELPTAVASPMSALYNLPRAIAAGFLGEGAKELGAPEWAQTAAELTAYLGPDVTKKLLATGKNKEIIEAARKLGLDDEAITPLIQSEFKQKWLTKISPKRGKTQQALEHSKQQLGESYNILQKSGSAKNFLSEKSSNDLFSSFSEKLKEMPSGVRNKIKEDFKDLTNAPITGDSLINFYKDINYYLSDNAKQLSTLKEPIKKALSSISPNLGKDFELINDLFSKYYTISSRLKPTIASDIVNAAESIGILGNLVTGNYPYLYGILGEKTSRKIAQQMLINPRLQNLSKKIIMAMNENKISVVKKLSDIYADEISQSSPETAKKLKELSLDDLEEFFNPPQ